MSSSWTPGTCKFTWLSWAPCRKSHQSHLATNPPWRWCAWMELQPGKATGTPLNCRLSVSTRICNSPPWSPVRSLKIFKKIKTHWNSNYEMMKMLMELTGVAGRSTLPARIDLLGRDPVTARGTRLLPHFLHGWQQLLPQVNSLVAQFVSVDLDLLKETRLSRMLTSFIHSAHYRCNFNCMFEKESLKAIIFTSVNSSLNAL